VVIVTYRCRELALRCLASIRRELPGVLEHTVVVDNHSGDGVLEAVERHFPRVRRIAKQRNVGFAAAANAGMRELRECDVIVLLNPDTLLLDGGLAAAAEYLRATRRRACLGRASRTRTPRCSPRAGHSRAI
jgi:GT2 family glycosyltransferase